MQRRIFIGALAAPSMLASTRGKGPAATFDAKLLKMMQVAPVPGAVYGVLRGGRLDSIRPLGVADSVTKSVVKADTIFAAASLTKQVTAYAAFALRTQGKIDFDRTLVSYVDDLEDSQARKVTIRHVLSHSSGFPNWRPEETPNLIPKFEPGTRFRYSGEGYFYLQRILEQVYGKGFGALVQELVFEPLGMKSSSLLWVPELDGRLARPHTGSGDPVPDGEWNRRAKRLHEYAVSRAESRLNWKYADACAAAAAMKEPPLPNWLTPNAASSMLTSAEDYAKFLVAAIKNPDIGKQQVEIRPALGWGLGWGIERAAGREYLWQWGDNQGFKNIVMVDAAGRSGVFVFTNGDAGARIYDRIVTYVTGHDHPALFWI